MVGSVGAFGKDRNHALWTDRDAWPDRDPAQVQRVFFGRFFFIWLTQSSDLVLVSLGPLGFHLNKFVAMLNGFGQGLWTYSQ